jgi:hypothetical protein
MLGKQARGGRDLEALRSLMTILEDALDDRRGRFRIHARIDRQPRLAVLNVLVIGR